MSNTDGAARELVIDRKVLRRAIGIVGFAIPLVLALVGWWMFGIELPKKSISSYYHSEMHDVFVGIFVAIAFCMLAYRGYDGWDRSAGIVACIAAASMALLPPRRKDPDLTCACELTGMELLAARIEVVFGYGHLVATVLFFLIFWWFVWRFRKGCKPYGPDKIRRNCVYMVCFVVMAVAGVAGILGATGVIGNETSVVFYTESLMIWAFSAAWLVKGEAIYALNDGGFDNGGRR